MLEVRAVEMQMYKLTVGFTQNLNPIVFLMA